MELPNFAGGIKEPLVNDNPQDTADDIGQPVEGVRAARGDEILVDLVAQPVECGGDDTGPDQRPLHRLRPAGQVGPIEQNGHHPIGPEVQQFIEMRYVRHLERNRQLRLHKDKNAVKDERDQVRQHAHQSRQHNFSVTLARV